MKMHVMARDIGAADLSPIRSEIMSAFSDYWKVKSCKAESLDVQALHVREMIRHCIDDTLSLPALQWSIETAQFHRLPLPAKVQI